MKQHQQVVSKHSLRVLIAAIFLQAAYFAPSFAQTSTDRSDFTGDGLPPKTLTEYIDNCGGDTEKPINLSSNWQETTKVSTLIETDMIAPTNNSCATTHYLISKTLQVDQDLALEHPFARISVAPQAQIIVTKGHKLVLKNTVLHGCGGTWKGILVEFGAVLEMENAFIEDADHPITYLPEKPVLTLQMFPNPASSFIKLTLKSDFQEFLPTDLTVQVLFMNSQGQVHLTTQVLSEGGNTFQADVSQLVPDTYTVSVQLPDGRVCSGEAIIIGH